MQRSEECLSARPALSTPSAQGVDRRCRGMRFRRTPSGAPVPACTASVFHSSVKGQAVAYENQQTASTHLSPLQTHQLASALPQTLLPDARSFFDRSIFAQVQIIALAPTSGPPKPWEMDVSTRRRRVRSLLLQAALWAPTRHSQKRYRSNQSGTVPQQNAGQGPTQSTSASTTRFRQRNQCQGVSKQPQQPSTRQYM